MIHTTTLYTFMCDLCDFTSRDTYRRDLAEQFEREHLAEDHTNGSTNA
jgi:hypothetical protein